MVNFGAFMFSTVMHLYLGYPHRRNYATVANVLKINNVKNLHFALYEFTCTVCFKIHFTMISLCYLYSCVMYYLSKMPNELRSPWTYFVFYYLNINFTFFYLFKPVIRSRPCTMSMSSQGEDHFKVDLEMLDFPSASRRRAFD